MASEGKLPPEATCEDYLQVQTDYDRKVVRTVKQSLTVELVSNPYQFNAIVNLKELRHGE